MSIHEEDESREEKQGKSDASITRKYSVDEEPYLIVQDEFYNAFKPIERLGVKVRRSSQYDLEQRIKQADQRRIDDEYKQELEEIQKEAKIDHDIDQLEDDLSELQGGARTLGTSRSREFDTEMRDFGEGEMKLRGPNNDGVAELMYEDEEMEEDDYREEDYADLDEDTD